MKRLITILLSAALCACFCPLNTRAGEDVDSLVAENARLRAELEATNELLEYFLVEVDQLAKGDINGDGYTDAVDASLILAYYAYSSSNSEPFTLKQYLLGGGSVAKSR